MTKLTDKHELFCRGYLVDLNTTQAAIRAGYSQQDIVSRI
ncbi:terminase small subunit [Gilliamella apicola]